MNRSNPSSQSDTLLSVVAAKPAGSPDLFGDDQADDPRLPSPATAQTLQAPTSHSDAALNLVHLDTAAVRTGAGHNRSADFLDTPEFEALVGSVLQTKGNTQPIVVNPIPKAEVQENSPHRYTLVSGHRRLAACEMLGFKVLALIRSASASDDPLLDRLIENHHRQNLSPIEFGRQVDELMSQRPDLSARKIGKALGCDHSLVLKARDVAKLPEAVVACFPSPNDIRYKDADQLKQALAKAPDAVLSEAQRIATEASSLNTSQVVQRLLQAAAQTLPEGAEGQGGEPFTTPAETALEIDGQTLGKVARDKKGHPIISLSVVLTEAQQAALSKSIEAFLRRRVLRSAHAKPAATDSKQPATAAHSERAGEAKRRAA